MTERKDIVAYRPPGFGLADPIGVRSVGRGFLPGGFATPERRLGFAQIIWSVSGAGMVSANRVTRKISGGQACVFFPGDIHSLAGAGDGWVYRWFTIDGVCAAQMMSAFGLEREPSEAGKCPENDFKRLRRLVVASDPKSARAASELAYSLLSKIADARFSAALPGMEDEMMLANARRLFEEAVSDPFAGVLDIADKLGMDRSVFSRRFTAVAGASPKKYLMSLRVSRAIGFLRNTGMPVAAVAKKCGFSDPNYFCKFFRRLVGCSPGEFRGKGTP